MRKAGASCAGGAAESETDGVDGGGRGDRQRVRLAERGERGADADAGVVEKAERDVVDQLVVVVVVLKVLQRRWRR